MWEERVVMYGRDSLFGFISLFDNANSIDDRIGLNHLEDSSHSGWSLCVNLSDSSLLWDKVITFKLTRFTEK